MKNNLLIVFTLFAFIANATTWLVGPTRTYTMPSQVSTLVQNGDTVLIDAAIYNSDVAYWSKNNLVLRGVGGMAHLKSNGLSYGDKAIWVIGGNNTTVEYIEFSLCTSTSQNGAGIRQEGLNLTVSHCYFHDNEDGILAGTLNPSTILIEYTEFDHNGAGDGFSHNLYINNIDTLIFRYNYSHHCTIGHEIKSRARVNYILYNRLSNESTGDASREIDLPNGGTCYVMGNVIEQGPNSQNSGIVGYGLEGLTNPTPHDLYFINNTVVNDRSTGTFVSIQTGTNLYKSYNNIFAGPGTILTGTPTTLDSASNLYCTVASAGFVNAAGYDYHLTPASPAIDKSTGAGSVGTFVLTPSLEYVHPCNRVMKVAVNILDNGAYEYTGGAGIFGARQEDEINIHPNPSNGHFFIETKEKTRIELFNMNGENVLSQEIESKTEITGDLSPGIYFLRSGSWVTKIVVQ